MLPEPAMMVLLLSVSWNHSIKLLYAGNGDASIEKCKKMKFQYRRLEHTDDPQKPNTTASQMHRIFLSLSKGLKVW